jgi:5-methylcytosine-specific restriction protein A
MPSKAPHPCNSPGCGAVTHDRFCALHGKTYRKQSDQRRGKTAERGYGGRWQRERQSFLALHPLCAECERKRRTTAADTVDHIVPHRGDQALMWDWANWQALCKPCHDEKTARDDGAFGRSAP